MSRLAHSSRETASPRPVNMAAVLLFMLALAAPACFFFLLPVPDLYGWLPLPCALICAREWGWRPGFAVLVAAFCISATGLGGGYWQSLLVLGAFPAVYYASRIGWMAAEAVALYGASFMVLDAIFRASGGIGVPWEALPITIPEVLGATMLVAVADLLNANFRFSFASPFIAPNPSSSVRDKIRSGANLALAFLLVIPVASLTALGGAAPGRFGPSLLLLGGMISAAGYCFALLRTLMDIFRKTSAVAVSNGAPERIMAVSHPPGAREMAHGNIDAPDNLFSFLKAGREHLLAAASDLNRKMGLKLLQDVAFDARTGVLRYVRAGIEEEVFCTLHVHPDDCGQFVEISGSEACAVEFRTAQGGDFESLLLSLRGSKGGLGWETGAMVELNQPRRLVDIMAKQARLVDLGAAASAIGHEIKQPLFTIAVAAESLRLLVEKPRSEMDISQMQQRIDRILQQVDRAREIIEHVSRYGKIDRCAPESIDVAETLQAAYGFLAPMIEDQRIDVVISVAEGAHMAVVSRIELEQVFVNAIQNAVDAIVMRRADHWQQSGQDRINLFVETQGSTVHCIISDNGIGLAPSIDVSAFNAFFTTKPDKGTGLGLFISRQIIAKAGGSIQLHGAENNEGAVLEIRLPATGAASGHISSRGTRIEKCNG